LLGLRQALRLPPEGVEARDQGGVARLNPVPATDAARLGPALYAGAGARAVTASIFDGPFAAAAPGKLEASVVAAAALGLSRPRGIGLGGIHERVDGEERHAGQRADQEIGKRTFLHTFAFGTRPGKFTGA
jgi:hypothetical protein